MMGIFVGEVDFIRKEHLNVLKKVGLVLLIGYILYSLIFGMFIFRFHQPTVQKEQHEYVTNKIGTEENIKDQLKDRVVLLEDGTQSGMARIDLIENAQRTIDIAYYTLQKGVVTDTFLGLLLEAADRDVQVNILLDGIFHNLRGNLKDIIYSFADHPNIQLKLYEPLHIMKPWTWNNRLHDKLMIVDDQFAIIGGRNIGDKYFIQEAQKTFVEDRDVLIVSQMLNNQSVVYDMKNYFEKLWI